MFGSATIYSLENSEHFDSIIRTRGNPAKCNYIIYQDKNNGAKQTVMGQDSASKGRLNENRQL